MVDRGRLRRQAAVWLSQPAPAAKASPAASALASGACARLARPRQHAQATGGLAEDGHITRVAAEPGYVALHPAQRCLLVHQPVVARRAARAAGPWRGGAGTQQTR